MTVRISGFLGVLVAGSMLMAGAATAADTAKLRPQVKRSPGTKTECPSGPTEVTPVPEPPNRKGLRSATPVPEPPNRKLRPVRPGQRHKANPRLQPPSRQGWRSGSPQPEPPTKPRLKRPLSPGQLKGFNPQPEPPNPDKLGKNAGSPC